MFVVFRDELEMTLHCVVTYTMFLMFLIDIFVLNSNPMSVSLKSLDIFRKFKVKDQFQGQTSMSRSIMIGQLMKLGPSVIPHFLCNFDWAINFRKII